MLADFINALIAKGFDFEVNSQMIEGDRWNEVVLPVYKKFCLVCNDTIVVYAWHGHDSDVDLQNSQPTDELWAEDVDRWLNNLAGVAGVGTGD